MQREDLLRFIRESRELARTASPQQQLRLLKLIREAYSKLKQSPADDEPTVYLLQENQDYLPEK